MNWFDVVCLWVGRIMVFGGGVSLATYVFYDVFLTYTFRRLGMMPLFWDFALAEYRKRRDKK